MRENFENFLMTIGLEIHAQLNCKTKLFSSSKSNGCDDPNKNISCFDLGLPGVLPRLNKEVISKAIQAAYALNSRVNENSRFDRKHYFYPDSPFGYQITQFFEPIALGGYIDIGERCIEIDHFHIETDAGKMIHGSNQTYLDFNRVGIPLIEIVTKPDIKTLEEFKKFVSELILHLQYAGVADCNMELGNFRIDVNISISATETLGTRVEIKNLNSIRFALKAIEYEYNRQKDLLKSGQCVIQETRGFDSDLGETFSMRTKEDALDYRYIPDYNIPPIHLDKKDIEKLQLQVPELPNSRRNRYRNLSIGHETIEVLVGDRELSDFFDYFQVQLQLKITELQIGNIARNNNNGIYKTMANLITTDLMGLCKKENLDHNLDPKTIISKENLLSIFNFLLQGKIGIKTAKSLLERLSKDFQSKDSQSKDNTLSVEKIIIEEDLELISDKTLIKSYCEAMIEENVSEWQKYLEGDDKMFMFFTGKVIKKSNNKANPEIVQEILKSYRN